jgi:hypothetical protein
MIRRLAAILVIAGETVGLFFSIGATIFKPR